MLFLFFMTRLPPGSSRTSTLFSYTSLFRSYGRLARSEGRAHGDGDAGVGPPPHDLVYVHLGAAGLGIVEVAPREDVDGPDPGRGGEIPDIVDRIGVVGGRWGGGVVPEIGRA